VYKNSRVTDYKPIMHQEDYHVDMHDTKAAAQQQ